jgi:hypothetical protein
VKEVVLDDALPSMSVVYDQAELLGIAAVDLAGKDLGVAWAQASRMLCQLLYFITSGMEQTALCGFLTTCVKGHTRLDAVGLQLIVVGLCAFIACVKFIYNAFCFVFAFLFLFLLLCFCFDVYSWLLLALRG